MPYSTTPFFITDLYEEEFRFHHCSVPPVWLAAGIGFLPEFYFRPTFHPGIYDDRALLQAAFQRYFGWVEPYLIVLCFLAR